jgi:hypothetical protein
MKAERGGGETSDLLDIGDAFALSAHTMRRLLDTFCFTHRGSSCLYVLSSGYGSLICPNSRAKTVPETAGCNYATPVVVAGVQRTWAKRARRMTAMGVSFADKTAECVGVLVPVEKRELLQFDQREQGYSRHILNWNNVHPVSSPDKKENSPQSMATCPFLRAKNEYGSVAGEGDGNICIWIYVQQQSEPPNANHPIVQSYVDIILGGCLSISEDFAKDFILHTKGWPAEDEDEEKVGNGNSTGKGISRVAVQQTSSIVEAVWVDDRHDPIYSRADQEWSLKMAHQLDELLRSNRPTSFKQRLPITPSFPQKWGVTSSFQLEFGFTL